MPGEIDGAAVLVVQLLKSAAGSEIGARCLLHRPHVVIQGGKKTSELHVARGICSMIAVTGGDVNEIVI